MTSLDAVIGLGNPGSQYAQTYHNVGFQAIDQLASSYSYTEASRDGGELFEINEGPASYLGKPGKMMNRSGQVVSSWADDLGWSPSSLLIIYDDFSLDVGTIRLRPSGSAGGHNGLADIIGKLETPEIPRLRLGIGPVSPGGDPTEFVLSRIISDDRAVFRKIFRQLPDIIEHIVEEGIQSAMNRWNGEDWNV
mgnify:CR=1 FL=1